MLLYNRYSVVCACSLFSSNAINIRIVCVERSNLGRPGTVQGHNKMCVLSVAAIRVHSPKTNERQQLNMLLSCALSLAFANQLLYHILIPNISAIVFGVFQFFGECESKWLNETRKERKNWSKLVASSSVPVHCTPATTRVRANFLFNNAEISFDDACYSMWRLARRTLNACHLDMKCATKVCGPGTECTECRLKCHCARRMPGRYFRYCDRIKAWDAPCYNVTRVTCSLIGRSCSKFMHAILLFFCIYVCGWPCVQAHRCIGYRST